MPKVRGRGILLLAGMWIAVVSRLIAQEAASLPKFDVASVKEDPSPYTPASFNVNGTEGNGNARNGGILSAINQDLSIYIVFAYPSFMAQYQTHAMRNQLPAWAQTSRYDIQARAESNPTKDEMRLMMRSLLAERFKLAVHTERRETPVYALEVATPGKLGPHLQAHRPPPCEDAPDFIAHGPGLIPTIAGGFPASCGDVILGGLGLSATGESGLPPSVPGDLRLAAREVSLSQLATALARWMPDRPVIDQTGLNGKFDFNLEFMPDNGPGSSPPVGGVAADAMGQLLQVALLKQLGLKLVRRNGPVETLAIDHVERPSEN